MSLNAVVSGIRSGRPVMAGEVHAALRGFAVPLGGESSHGSGQPARAAIGLSILLVLTALS
jgi:hypothetical protein